MHFFRKVLLANVGVISYLTWLAMLFPIAAEAGCLEDTRPVQLGDQHVRLRTFLCGPDDNSDASPVLRLEFHRLSDVAASSFAAGANLQYMDDTLGSGNFVENEVYTTLGQFVQRFGREHGRDGWGENGGINLTIETPRGGLGGKPEIDQKVIVYAMGQDYAPSLRSVPNPAELSQGWRHYYLRSGLGNEYRGRLWLWRYASENDLRGGNGNDVSLVNLERFLYSRGCPKQLFAVWANLEEVCGGDEEPGWTLTLARVEPIVDFVTLQNISGNSVEISQLYGLSSNENLCRKGSSATSFSENPSTKLLHRSFKLSPNERLLVPVKFSFAGPLLSAGIENANLDKDAQDVFDQIRFTQSNTPINFGGGLYLYKEQLSPPQKPPVSEYAYGPEWQIRAVEVDGSPITLSKKSSNFLNLAITSGGASCPYLLAWNPNSEKWTEYGKILHEATSKSSEREHVLRISAFRSRFLLAEREPEIAYIDQAELSIELKDGRSLVISASDQRLALRDGQYLVLRQGQTAEFRFDLPKDVKESDITQSTLTVFGYYEPLERVTRN